MQPREPRKPRVLYNKFINLRQQYIPIDTDFTDDTQEGLLPKRVKSKISKADYQGNIKFHGDEWNVYNMDKVCQKIKKWNIPKGLFIETSKQHSIVAHLCKIDFSSLLYLKLSNNNIQSIDLICQIMFPRLQRLVLSNNKILSIKSLRKSYLPNLTSCSLGGNKIIEFCWLNELHAPKLQYISQEHRHEKRWGDTFNWIGKIQSNQLQKLWIRSDNRIWQTSAQNCFQRKFSKRKQITFYVGLINGVV